MHPKVPIAKIAERDTIKYKSASINSCYKCCAQNTIFCSYLKAVWIFSLFCVLIVTVNALCVN